MRFISSIALLAALCAFPTYGAITLSAGTYAMFGYVAKVTTTGTGTCNYHVGEQYTEFFIYPGPNRTGASKKQLIETSTDHFVGIDIFPKTPAAGVNSWSGTYRYSFLPGGPNGTGKFTWIFNIVETTAFTATRTFTGDVAGGSCTITLDESAVRTGN